MNISRSGSFELDMTPAEALPLFTAEGERLWVPNWDPVVLSGDGYGKGTVFVTTNHGVKTHWLVMDYDTEALHALYVRVTPDVTAGTVDVSIAPRAPGGSIVTVAYQLTALGPAGEETLRASFSESNYAQMMQEWQALIEQNRDRIRGHFSR